MPVVKIIPSRSNPKRLEDYVKDPEKTKSTYSFSYFCDSEDVTNSFTHWNSCYKHKSKGIRRSYYHIIISWNPKDQLSAENCKAMAKEICENTSLKDYPLYGTIHTDREHLHAHLIVNNCSIFGKSYQSTRESTRELKRIANDICKREGYLYSIIDPDKKANIRITTSEAQLILKKNKMPWKDELRYQIDTIMESCCSIEDFIQEMQRVYQVQVLENRKGELRFQSSSKDDTKEQKKLCPARRLGNQYSRAEMEKMFEQNRKKKQQGKAVVR